MNPSRPLLRTICLAALLAGCRTFPEYSDDAMRYDNLVYASDWRFIVVPKETEKKFPSTAWPFPPHRKYERLFRQAEILPLIRKQFSLEQSPLTTADFLLECDSLISELLQIDPIRDYPYRNGVQKAPQIYEMRDRLIRELYRFRKLLTEPVIPDEFRPKA